MKPLIKRGKTFMSISFPVPENINPNAIEKLYSDKSIYTFCTEFMQTTESDTVITKINLETRANSEHFNERQLRDFFSKIVDKLYDVEHFKVGDRVKYRDVIGTIIKIEHSKKNDTDPVFVVKTSSNGPTVRGRAHLWRKMYDNLHPEN